MERPEKSYEVTDYGWLVAMSFVFLALVALALWREALPSWSPIQSNFRNALQKYAGVQKADTFQSGIKQIWIPKIQVVDRCVTCHLGYDWGAVLPATLAEPLMPHPISPTWTSIRSSNSDAPPVMAGRAGRPLRMGRTATRAGTIRCCR